MDKLKQLAEEGNPLAQFCCGLMHHNGHGEQLINMGVQSVPKSVAIAAKWYLAAAKQGCSWAMYDYAMLCDSKDERLRWLHEAANRGLADAQVALIRYYCDLDKGAKIIDVVEAYKWALLAAEQRHPCVFETNEFEILEYRMTPTQVTEAKQRAAIFTARDSRC
jgi:hypothetical protein